MVFRVKGKVAFDPQGTNLPGCGSEFFPRVIAGTTDALKIEDSGGGVRCTNAAAVSLLVPTGLGAFVGYVIQGGAGKVTLTPASGVTITNRQSFSGTAGQGAVISLIAIAADTYILGGDGA
jgi:hypothetical protein